MNSVLHSKALVHPVGKTIPEVQKAYLAGFIDGDGPSWPSSNATRPNGSGSAFASRSRRLSCVS